MGFLSGLTDMFKERKVSPELTTLTDDYKNVREPLINWLNQNIGKTNAYTGQLTAGKTAQEAQSLDFLNQYAGADNSALRKSASSEIQKTLTGGYDPTLSPYYQAVKAEAARNLNVAQNNIASNAAGGGRYWSGARLKQQSDTAAQTANSLNQTVYGLADKERQRKIDIIPQALSAATQEEQIPLQKATALQTLGSLDRNIQQAQLDAAYKEWNRATNEYPLQVAQLASGVEQAPTYGEVKRLPSTAMGMWGSFNPIVGTYNQQKYGYSNGQVTMSDLIKMMAQSQGAGGAGGGMTPGAMPNTGMTQSQMLGMNTGAYR